MSPAQWAALPSRVWAIIRAVAQERAVSPEDIMRYQRTGPVADARQECYRRLREMSWGPGHPSLLQIGVWLHRDHTTVHQACEGSMHVETFSEADLFVDAKVDCGGCRLCCYHQRVAVLPGIDPVERYETESVPDSRMEGLGQHGPVILLKLKPDGSCIHLGPTGCEVYDHRPRICRAFDCGGWFRSVPRGERRQMIRKDPEMRPLIERGRVISARQLKRG